MFDPENDEFPEGTELLFDSNRGQYIPQNFAQEIKRECVTGVSDGDWKILEAGPSHEWYWDAWNDVVQNARVTDPVTKVTFYLYQDGDVWLIPKRKTYFRFD